jgi:hypothetical protein
MKLGKDHSNKVNPCQKFEIDACDGLDCSKDSNRNKDDEIYET